MGSSGVGDKPVMVSGRTYYGRNGFTSDVSLLAEFRVALDKALADPAGVALNWGLPRRYVHAFLFRAPVSSPGIEEHVLGLARITVGDLSELEPGRDPALDHICDGIPGGGNFNPPRP